MLEQPVGLVVLLEGSSGEFKNLNNLDYMHLKIWNDTNEFFNFELNDQVFDVNSM
jgi:hypothetical protein